MGLTMIEIICEHCGKSFQRAAKTHKHNIKCGKLAYCSIKCSAKHNIELNGPPNKGKYNMIDLICEYCGKDFQRRECEVNGVKRSRGQAVFCCSKECANKRSEHILYEYHYPNETEKEKKFKPLLQRTQNTHKDRKRVNPRFKDMDYDLTIDYIAELWEQQNGKCYFSGIDLEITKYYHKRSPISPFQASIDRIDNNKGYIQGNIRIVSVIANFAKNRFSDEELIAFCHAVANQHKHQTAL
jgi:hypothetical protein